jgi:ATP-binding cassette subfamily F protein 3
LEVTVRSVLGHFLFSGEDVEKKISTLSGGEKARVALAKLMLKQANVLILDEPTNHLDLYSKEALESALMEYEGTLLFISHDRYFLNKLAERILELDASGLKTYLGNYDDYIEKKKELAEIEQELAQIRPSASSGQKTGDSRDPAEKSESHARPHYEEMKRKRQEERNRQRKAERLEQEMTNLEEEIHNLELELAKPEVYLDHVKVIEIQEEIKRKQRELDKAYTEWESLL